MRQLESTHGIPSITPDLYSPLHNNFLTCNVIIKELYVPLHLNHQNLCGWFSYVLSARRNRNALCTESRKPFPSPCYSP